MELGILLLFILITLCAHDVCPKELEILCRTFKKRPSLYTPLLVLILVIFWYKIKFQLPYIDVLLFLPDDLDIKNEVLDVLTPALFLFIISFYIFRVRWMEVQSSVLKNNINRNVNISLLSKVVTGLTVIVFYPLSKSFISSNINTTIIDVVGYSSTYFPNFENIIFAFSLIIQITFIVALLNILFLYSYLIEFKWLIMRGKVSAFRFIRFFVVLVIIVSNVILSIIVLDRIHFVFSDNENNKEIKELLLVTSYNEIPNRCRLLLNVYGNKEKALLSFIDVNLASIYIIDDDVFINESCK